MEKEKLAKFNILYNEFKQTEDYKERKEQSCVVPIAKDIIAETLKNEPLKNEHLTGLLHMLKADCSDENFEKYLVICIADDAAREQLKNRAYTCGENGYTGAGKRVINELSAAELAEVKSFLQQAFHINNFEEAISLCEQYDAKEIPVVTKGIYSPWLYYINPAIFPITNNSHIPFLKWMGVSTDYPACIRLFHDLQNAINENDLGMIDAFTHRFTEDKEPLRTLSLNGHKLYKISHGVFVKNPAFKKADTANKLKQRNWICLHSSTGKNQADLFAEALTGDYVYLMHGGNDLGWIAKIISPAKKIEDEDLEIVDYDEGWLYREVEPLFEPVNTDVTELKDERSFWMPSGNSTFFQMPPEDIDYANRKIFIPKYNVKLVDASDESVDETDNNKAIIMSHPNTILYGPPGTGKTYNTILKAAEIIKQESFENRYEEAKKIYKELSGDQMEFITFHQNYSYEDFVAGLRPDVESPSVGIRFVEHKGIFYKICQRAKTNYQQHSSGQTYTEATFEDVLETFLEPLEIGDEIEVSTIARNANFHITANNRKNLSFRKQNGGTGHTLSISTMKAMYEGKREYNMQGVGIYLRPVVEKLKELGKQMRKETGIMPLKNYVLIIDEINRANISRVFGELITLLEPDKRLGAKHELSLTLPGLPEDEKFTVPPNLYIVGTMNTADKSIALLDIALRRRFHFEGMYPDSSIKGVQYTDILDKINEQILAKRGADFLIGHAYFMNDDNGNFDLADTMNYKVIPLMNEYFYNQKGDIVKNIIEQAIAGKPMHVEYDQYRQLKFSMQ